MGDLALLLLSTQQILLCHFPYACETGEIVAGDGSQRKDGVKFTPVLNRSSSEKVDAAFVLEEEGTKME